MVWDGSVRCFGTAASSFGKRTESVSPLWEGARRFGKSKATRRRRAQSVARCSAGAESDAGRERQWHRHAGMSGTDCMCRALLRRSVATLFSHPPAPMIVVNAKCGIVIRDDEVLVSDPAGKAPHANWIRQMAVAMTKLETAEIIQGCVSEELR